MYQAFSGAKTLYMTTLVVKDHHSRHVLIPMQFPKSFLPRCPCIRVAAAQVAQWRTLRAQFALLRVGSMQRYTNAAKLIQSNARRSAGRPPESDFVCTHGFRHGTRPSGCIPNSRRVSGDHLRARPATPRSARARWMIMRQIKALKLLRRLLLPGRRLVRERSRAQRFISGLVRGALHRQSHLKVRAAAV